jgi:hypothetical protein
VQNSDNPGPTRESVRAEYGAIFDQVARLLFESDPLGINLETNIDEYEPEAMTIVSRLGAAKSAVDVEDVVYEEFCRWFGAADAGPRERYRPIAAKLWELWRTWKLRPA